MYFLYRIENLSFFLSFHFSINQASVFLNFSPCTNPSAVASEHGHDEM